MKRRVNVRGIAINEQGSLLAVKHRGQDGSESEFWATPGGGVDEGESLLDGLTREFVEELGIVPEIGRVLFMQQYTRTRLSGEKIDCLEVLFHIKNHREFEKEIDLSKTSHGHELARVAFIDPKVEDLLPDFLQKIDIPDQINNDRPVHIIDNLHEPSR
ncbi:MAG: hydrolase [Candidatus Saccharibacteria bacterium]|nr:hydrolase [Candidatus Saccharibacteria bacterium]